jgi:hypothetical protein
MDLVECINPKADFVSTIEAAKFGCNPKKAWARKIVSFVDDNSSEHRPSSNLLNPSRASAEFLRSYITRFCVIPSLDHHRARRFQHPPFDLSPCL